MSLSELRSVQETKGRRCPWSTWPTGWSVRPLADSTALSSANHSRRDETVPDTNAGGSYCGADFIFAEYINIETKKIQKIN